MLVAQSCQIFCEPMDYSAPGSSVYRILQPRILEQVAIPFSKESSQSRDPTWISYIAGGFFYSLSHQGTPFFSYISILFQIISQFRLLQSFEQSSLCCTVGPCRLSILYITVCACQSLTPHLYISSALPLYPLVTVRLFSKSVSLFLLCI